MEKRRAYPEIVVAVASAAWGLFWIPLRAFERHGLNPGWAALAQFVAPLVILTPFALARLLRGKPRGVAQFRSGLLIGAAVALYLESQRGPGSARLPRARQKGSRRRRMHGADSQTRRPVTRHWSLRTHGTLQRVW